MNEWQENACLLISIVKKNYNRDANISFTLDFGRDLMFTLTSVLLNLCPTEKNKLMEVHNH